MITGELCPAETTVRFEAGAIPHFSVLKRFALHFVRDRTEAENIVQETFTQPLKWFSGNSNRDATDYLVRFAFFLSCAIFSNIMKVIIR